MLLDEEILEVVQRFAPAPAAALSRTRPRRGPGPEVAPRPASDATSSIASCRPTSITSPSSAASRRRASPRTGSDLAAFGRFLAKAQRRRRRRRRARTSAGTCGAAGAGSLRALGGARALGRARASTDSPRAHLGFREDPTADIDEPEDRASRCRRPLAKKRSRRCSRRRTRRRRSGCGTARCSSCSMPRACASPRSSGLPRDARGPGGRDPARHGQGRQGAPRPVRQVGRALARALPRGGAAGPRREALADALSLRARRRDDAPALLAAHRGVRADGRHPRRA